MRQPENASFEIFAAAFAEAHDMGTAGRRPGKWFNSRGATCDVLNKLDVAGFEIVPKPAEGGHYVLTPEGAAIIQDLVAHTALTQESVTAAGDALDREFDAAPSRFVRHISGRDHAVSANALAVRDVIEAHRLLGLAVATLGHEAVDEMMRALPDSILGAAAA